MPVRSLSSSILKWPDRSTVHAALRQLAEREAAGRPGLLAVGYFGSFARGGHGVGSDVDVVAIVDRSVEPFERRGAAWDLTSLPVPADLLVYTLDEWRELVARDDRFARTLRRETVWVFGDPSIGPAEGP